MILYVNGDSHTAAAECVTPHAFAEDDPKLWYLGRRPHPENIEHSWGKLLSQRLSCGFKCNAESASSNDRIIRTTREWMNTFPDDLYKTLMVIQWSTWEREEWLIDGKYYQINASGIDEVPESHQNLYKEFVAGVNWQQKTKEAHEKVWDFHQELESLKVKHIFFNGNNDFSKISDRKDWGESYIGPYDPQSTFNHIVGSQCDTVAPHSYHYGADGHRVWTRFILKYIVDNNFV